MHKINDTHTVLLFILIIILWMCIALKSWQNVTKCMADGGNAEEDYIWPL